MVSKDSLNLHNLMTCYDMCTTTFLDRLVGHSADVSNESCRYGFLQEYRTTHSDSKVQRLFICRAKRYEINDQDALELLLKKGIVILPLVEPEANKCNLFPPGVAYKIFLYIYNNLLYYLWRHLRTFNHQEFVRGVTFISFQNVSELDEMRTTFYHMCSELKDSNNISVLVDIQQVVLQELEKYTVRG